MGADRGGRRRDLPAVRAAGAGGAERAREGAAVHRPQHRGHHARRWGSATSRSRPFELETDPDAIDLAGNADTVRNIRIWDPSEPSSASTFPQLQRIRDYYAINNVDVDRYELNGEPTQVVLSVRDLNTDGIPRKSWAAEHLTYTHGYGAIVAPANEKEPSGEPAFVAEDIPYRASADELELTQPAVYFGEDLGGYVVVGSKQRELNFEDEDETKYTTYEGEDGVALDNVIKKAAFALRFGDVNPLISDQLTGSSRVLYIRDIRERVQALAPFLDLDADPYPVIHDGRIVWIVDAYTTTVRYPYAQRVETGQLPDDSGLDHTFNYVRNSVKAVVDAYDGTVDFYVMPVDDPIIEAYRDAFPKLFKDFEDMPEDLQAHLRYPEDLFRLQTNSWAKYHVTEADSFYQGNDFWDVALDPGTGSPAPGCRVRRRHEHHDDHHRGRGAVEPRGPHRSLLPVHQAPGRDGAGVRAAPAVRARAGERRQPAA